MGLALAGSECRASSSLKFLCRAYTEAIRARSNSYASQRIYAGEERRAPMLTMALLIGFAFVCLVILHDRLTNRL
jgi:hypothetical protein